MNISSSGDHELGRFFLSSTSSKFLFAAGLLISLIGTVLNLIVLISLTFYAKSSKNAASTKFVINLAMADLLFCSLALPMGCVAKYLSADPVLGDIACKTHLVLFHGTFLLSVTALTSVTFNRLIIIAFNQKMDQFFSPIKTRLLIAFCWLFSFSFTLLSLFDIWGSFIIIKTSKHSGYYCGLLPSPNGTSPKTFYYVFGFTLPLITITITYVLIWFKVRRHKKQFTDSRAYRTNIKFFKVIVAIFGAFIVCYLPNLIVRGLFKWSSDHPMIPLRHFVQVLLWSNSCLNPIIYSYNREYYKALRKMFGLKGKPLSATSTNSSIVTKNSIAYKPNLSVRL